MASYPRQNGTYVQSSILARSTSVPTTSLSLPSFGPPTRLRKPVPTELHSHDTTRKNRRWAVVLFLVPACGMLATRRCLCCIWHHTHARSFVTASPWDSSIFSRLGDTTREYFIRCQPHASDQYSCLIVAIMFVTCEDLCTSPHLCIARRSWTGETCARGRCGTTS